MIRDSPHQYRIHGSTRGVFDRTDSIGMHGRIPGEIGRVSSKNRVEGFTVRSGPKPAGNVRNVIRGGGLSNDISNGDRA
jgi:hypothetical protein